jgi:hypothetical protein
MFAMLTAPDVGGAEALAENVTAASPDTVAFTTYVVAVLSV